MGQDGARGRDEAAPRRSSNSDCAPGLGAGRLQGVRDSLRRARPGGLRAEPVATPASVDPDLAIRFIHASFPGMFPDEPAQSLPREGVKFTVSPDGRTSDGFAWALASGRVDLSAVISMEPEPDGRFVIPVLEILRPITLMAVAVSGPAYSRLYGKTRFRLRWRFDWFIAMSTELVRPADGVTVPWGDLEFPGRRPRRARTGQYRFCLPGGYAGGSLSNWNPRRPVSKLLAVFLDDFLKQNGFHATADAVADSIAAAAALGSTSRTAIGRPQAGSSSDGTRRDVTVELVNGGGAAATAMSVPGGRVPRRVSGPSPAARRRARDSLECAG